jgi:hypothetical protein
MSNFIPGICFICGRHLTPSAYDASDNTLFKFHLIYTCIKCGHSIRSKYFNRTVRDADLYAAEQKFNIRTKEIKDIKNGSCKSIW